MGLYTKGQSGNPGGRPRITDKKLVSDIRELARTHSKEALETLVAVMKSKSASPGARLTAANSLLDRAWGKPQQTIEATVTTTFDGMTDDELRDFIARETATFGGGHIAAFVSGEEEGGGEFSGGVH